MADRLLRLPRIPALTVFGARAGAQGRAAQPARTFKQTWRGAVRRPTDVPLLLWRVLWLPYWLGSDVPAPHLPTQNIAVPAASGLAGQHVVRMLDAIRRRVWLLWALTTIVRGAWLGALAGCVWLLIERAGGPEFDVTPLYWVGGAALAIGVVFAIVNRPTRTQTARMLDRSFRLHERISTALGNLGKDVPADGARAQVTYLQVADAANVIAELRRHPAFRLRPPLRELVLALICALVLAGLFFMRGIGGDIPALEAANIPAFSPASTRPRPPESTGSPGTAPSETGEGPTSEEVQARAQRSNEAQRDLNTLGDALDNFPVTNAAAEAIAEGDYDEAAAELRDVGAQSDQLSQESRTALAADLDQAAEQMSPGSSELADATRSAANGLREGGEPAQQGLNELGNQVQETGSEVASQQELREQLSQAQAQESSQSSESNPQEGQEGQSGEQPPGEGGEASQSGAGEQPDDNSMQGEGGEGEQPGAGEGENGDPGSEGADAAPSNGGQQANADRGSNPAGARETGRGEQRGRDRQASPQGAPGEGQPGAGADPSQVSPSGEQAAAPSEESGGADAGQQGEGAGSGQGESDSAQQPTDGGESNGQEEAGTEGPPSEEQVTESGPPPEALADLPEPESGDSTVDLENSGGGGIQTSTNAGSASAGSGTGVMTASGSTTQQEVDEAGPDSNRVPADDRDIVEDYFSEPGDGG